MKGRTERKKDNNSERTREKNNERITLNGIYNTGEKKGIRTDNKSEKTNVLTFVNKTVHNTFLKRTFMVFPVLLLTGVIIFVQVNASEKPGKEEVYEEEYIRFENTDEDGIFIGDDEDNSKINPDENDVLNPDDEKSDEDKVEDDNDNGEGEGEGGNLDCDEDASEDDDLDGDDEEGEDESGDEENDLDDGDEDEDDSDSDEDDGEGNDEGEESDEDSEEDNDEGEDNGEEGEDNGEGEGEYVPLEYEDLAPESERAILTFTMPKENTTIDGAAAFTDIPKIGIEIATRDAVLTKVTVIAGEKNKAKEESVLYEDSDNQILTYEEGTCVIIDSKNYEFDDILKTEKDGLYSVKVTMEYLTVLPVYDEKNQRTLTTAKKSETFEQDILIDSKAPELLVTFSDSLVSHYYNHSRNAVVKFKDDNIDEESLNVLINGKNYTEYSKEKSGNSGYEEYIISFNEESTYKGSVSVKDKLGNERTVSIEEFCIDTTAPLIEVNVTDEEQKFTNKKRIAKAEISDAHLIGENEITYEFKEGADRFEIMVCDKAGNITEYKSKNYIQDYVAPEGEIEGFESFKSYNKDFGFNISASDKWLDVKKSYVEITGLYNGSSNRYFFEKDKDKKVTFETMGYPDDYYVVEYVLYDNAGNISNEKKHFTLNRKGSTFFLDENLEGLMGKSLREISGVSMSEWNLNKIIPEKGKVIFAVNATVKDMTQGVDYTIEENAGNVGYSYNYRFNDSLFKEEGVYTISVRSVDEAGNDNDSHLSKDDVRIVFAIEKAKPETVIPEEAKAIKVKAVTENEITDEETADTDNQTEYGKTEEKTALANKDNVNNNIENKTEDKTNEEIIIVETQHEKESMEILVKVMFIIIAFLTATGTVIALFLIVRKG